MSRPLYLFSSPSQELLNLAIFISAIAYGVVLSLYILCCRVLFKGLRKYSVAKKWFLLGYSTIMLSLSTLATVEGIGTVLFPPTSLEKEVAFYFPASVIALPFTIWGTDIFMMWRCAVLYQEASNVSRVVLISVIIMLLLALLVSGFFFLLDNFNTIRAASFIVLGSTSLFVNVILSLLIAVRIRQYQQYIRQTLGPTHGSIYTRIIIICVESCALIAVLLALTLALFGVSSNGFQIPMALLPQICAISPLLIVFRVAQGTEVTATVNAPNGDDDRANRVTADIQFAPAVSSGTSEGM